MSNIFNHLIRTSDNWGRLKLTHKKVTTLGFNDREEPSFDDSVITVTTFYAQESEVPDYNSDRTPRPQGIVNKELKVFVVPGDMTFNDFISDGVRDRIQIEGYGAVDFEVFSVDVDRFMGITSTQIFLQRLAH